MTSHISRDLMRDLRCPGNGVDCSSCQLALSYCQLLQTTEMADVLAQSFLFGLQRDVTNNILFYDDESIVFPCGKTCVCYNFVHKRQKFISASEKSQGMRAMAISANRRFLAISERGGKAAITVFDLQNDEGRKRKMLSAENIVDEDFVCMAFSPNSKYLLAQTGGREWMLVLWLWENQKVVSTMKTTNASNPVNQVSFNPYNNIQVCVSGSGVFQVLCYSEGSFKQTSFPKVVCINFVSHAWITEDQVITATSTGRMLVFQHGDLHWVLDMTALEIPDRQVEMKKTRGRDINEGPTLTGITFVVAYSKGFACSTKPGRVCLYEKTAKNTYRKSREIQIPRHCDDSHVTSVECQEITSMCMSPSEETLAVSTDRGQLYGINMFTVDISKERRLQFEFLSQPFHSECITDLSVCTWKPIVATCSLDHSVRIWNYETKMLEVVKEFHEQPYTVALHPTGLFILVGFSDKLWLMGLHVDDICMLKDFAIQSCKECSFSHGGHLFAAASGNVIHIYSLSSFENIHSLKGHNGKISDMKWSMDDSRLVSCGVDGALYEWNTHTGKRESDTALKSCTSTSAAFSSDGRSVLTVGSDHTLKELRACQIVSQVAADDIAFTAMAVSHSGHVVFAGTDTGNIAAIQFPSPCEKKWMLYRAHCGPVTKMVITFDGQFLLTVSEDCCLALWKILHHHDCGIKNNKHIEETLISKSHLEDKSQKMLELKVRLEEIEMENEYQLRVKEMNYNEKMRESCDKFTQQAQVLETAQQEMRRALEKQEVEHRQSCDELIRKHSKEVQALESSYSQKLIVEHEKYQDLQKKCEKMQEDYKEQLKSAAESKSREVEKLSQLHEVKLEEKTQLLAKCQRDEQQQSLKFQHIIQQLEEDEVRKIHDMQIKYEKKLLTEKESNKHLQEDATIMKQKLSSLQRQVDDRHADISVLKQERNMLLALIQSLQEDIKDLKWHNCGHKRTSEDKDKTISDLKKKHQELEKFKFLLDFQLSELKKQTEPQQESINEKKERIHQLEDEIVKMDKDNTQLKLTISDLKLKLRNKDKDMHKEMQRVGCLDTKLHRLKADLQDCVSFIQEPRKLKKSVQMIYARYVQHTDEVDKNHSVDVWRTLSCQQDNKEKTLPSFKSRRSKSAADDQDKNYIKIMKENVTLIGEINEQRNELRQLRSELKDYKAQMDLFKRSNSSSTTQNHGNQHLN
ncbi:cilia- and flagella-associated protein 57 [Dunckerocampus dactyliophorus]|uniref:cilia- and flagella-associated protein 57 n=1 Tax=Dunckerocampus dactyliophorus TaxID=161453 RepID=UPI002405F9C3|nr:cilia- and flagella-associated protein 57 [Dunckerocampus dactyliophorus]